VANGATTVTLAGAGAPLLATAPLAGEIERGSTFRFAGDDVDYYIASVTNDTTFELLDPYRGTTVAGPGNAYAIDPAGIRTARILTYPDVSFYLNVEYKRKVLPMIQDNDTPVPIPEEFHETVLLKLAIVEALRDRRLPAEDIERDYMEALFKMNQNLDMNYSRHGVRIQRMIQTGRFDVGYISTSSTVT
jgi:hypothetical protein